MIMPVKSMMTMVFMMKRHHGQLSWSERGTRGASQAANATNEKYKKKTRGTTGKHYTSAKLHHRDVRR